MLITSNKKPLFKSENYSDWVHLVKSWIKFTDLEATRQRTSLVMLLDGNVLDTFLGLDVIKIYHTYHMIYHMNMSSQLSSTNYTAYIRKMNLMKNSKF